MTKRSLLLATVTRPRAGAPIQARVEAYLLAQAQRLFGRAEAVNGDLETIHQMRVASRRLRVGLRFFGALFPAAELRQLQRHLRRITRALGAVRLLDVNVQVLRKLTPKLPPATRRTRASLEHRLLAERATRVAELRELVGVLVAGQLPQQTQSLITAHQRYLDRPRLLRDSTAALDKLRRRLRRRYRQYTEKRGRGALHKFRLAAKRYRYALEASQAVFRVTVGKRLAAVHVLQDLMGDCHDVEVLGEYLERLDKHAAGPDKILAAERRLLLKSCRREEDRRFDRFEEFLAQGTPWLKKIKLRVSDE